MKHAILLVDDEVGFYDVLKEGLPQYTLHYAESIKEALEKLQKETYDLVLMDWNLGDESGLDLTVKLKENFKTNKIPVIMLTGNKEEDKMVEALKTGADDYVSKPFNLEFLDSKIVANLRKYGINNKEKQVFFKDIHLDENTFSVRIKGQTYELRRKEFAILKQLILNPEKCFSREELNRITSGEAVHVSNRSIDTFVRYIREKTMEDMIVTVHGQGYRINPNIYS